MRFNIENFDNITSDSNILSDITTNKLSTPHIDIINEKNKIRIDTIIKEINSKQKLINSLENRINIKAIDIVNNVNNEKNLSGKNIFFTTIPYIDIYNNLTPIGIMSREQVKAANIINKNNLEPPLNAVKNEFGFKTSLYELAELVGREKMSVLIGIPVRVANKGAVLSNAMRNAGSQSFTEKIPNINHSFFYSIQPSISSLPTTISDFNLSYTKLLPVGLMNSNFLSIGYNGYIYVGTDVKKLNKKSKNNFLDDLINNYASSGGIPYFGCMQNSLICGNKNKNTVFLEQSLHQNGNTTTSSQNSIENSLKDSEKPFFNDLVWLSLLTNTTTTNIVGPSLNDWASTIYNLNNASQNEIIKEAFLTGGLKPTEYIGCYKDFPNPNRLLPTYGGVTSKDGCAQKAISEGYNLFGLQDGGGVGRRNFTNGQCWLSKSSFSELPGCDNHITESAEYPECQTIDGTIWAMCENTKVARWGDSGATGSNAIKDMGNCNFAAKKQKRWGACPQKKEILPHGKCKVEEDNCLGNPKIGKTWTNALYYNNNAPSFQPARLYIEGFNIGKIEAGSLVYTYPNSKGEIQTNILSIYYI